MQAIRSLSRLAPRSVCSISSQCTRTVVRSLQRPQLASTSFLKTSAFRPIAAFSTTRIRCEQEGLVNDELAMKLENELSLEKDMRDSENLPAHLNEYLENSSFKIEDTVGSEDVIMTRTFGDEKIRIAFSIQDLNEAEDDVENLQDDSSMMDEMDDPADLPAESAQSGGANTKGSVARGRTSAGNIRVAPEDRVAPADREELADEDGMEDDENQEPSFPAHLNITVERPGKGALQFEAIAQDGLIVIEQVYYFKDSPKQQTTVATTTDFKGDPYTGPPFSNLDEDLQVLFEKYLEERGINTQLALFVPEYIDFKEQREYLDWLSGVKNFVE